MSVAVSERGVGVRWSLVLFLCAVLLAVGRPAVAGAVAAGPVWQLRAVASPSAFSASDSSSLGDKYDLILTNVGRGPSDGTPVTVTGTLPPGVTIKRVEADPEFAEWSCVVGGSSFTCEWPTVVGALEQAAELDVALTVDPGVAPDTVVSSVFSVSGGGAPGASASISTTLNPSVPVLFGVQDVFSFPADAAGAPDAQAADHPNSLSIGFDFTSSPAPNTSLFNPHLNSAAVEDLRDIVVDLPVGFSGNPTAVPACPLSALVRGLGYAARVSGCPLASEVGTVDLNARGHFDQRTAGGWQPELEEVIPLFNMIPERGRPAELGTLYGGFPVVMYPTVVGSGASAHLRVDVPGIPAVSEVGVQGAQVTLFGDPAEKSGGVTTPGAFLTNPSWCSGQPLTTTVYGDSYENPGRRNRDGSPDLSDPAWVRGSTTTAASSGCASLHFNPSMSVHPETTQADAPSGASVEFRFPQNSDPHGVATPALRDVKVALPAGVSVSPPVADGLQACSDAQFEASSHEPASCPAASQLGTVTATTPILAQPLTGQVFVGTPECSPCTAGDAQSGRMVRLFMQVEGPGVVLKFPGSASIDPATGQLTATFQDLIQQPVSDVQVQLKGGPRAPLATSQTCGTATTTSDLTPWSAPETPDAMLSSSFNVDWDGQGGACPASLPFSPAFSAGTEAPVAGAFSPFVLTFSRQDREQDFQGLQQTLPAGLLAKLAGVPLCGDAQASAGACPAGSQIGSVTVGVGAGSHPFYATGKIYLTGPYNGGPFGETVVVPAAAGPFNLGTVVVRGSIRIDPHTAQASVVSDPFPAILDGVPLRVKTVNVTLDRPGFTFNPTNCTQQQLTGTITAAQGASANVSSPFAVTGCAGLAFKPSFTVSTQAATSKKQGASLDVRVGYPSGAQANIRSVAVSLPRQLPARLTTIQQACTAAVFNANPAGCPAGSNIGTATATTPVLAGALTGPAYLVSHGGAAFPDLVIVLQGEGVTVDLVGSIDIKHGVTSSAFASIPDAPIASFDLKLPEGPHSGLAAAIPAKAKGNMCAQKLTMPTTITGQNGAVVRQTTKIAVTGCAKTKTKPRAKKHAKKHTRAHGGKGK
jgi:hypothetical protein